MISLAAIHEIEEINTAGVLPGVHLGYLMCDTCSHASKALQNVGHMLAVNRSLNVQCDYIGFRPRVKIILGARYSEVSIAVARLLNVYMVPLVSHCNNSRSVSLLSFSTLSYVHFNSFLGILIFFLYNFISAEQLIIFTRTE